MTALTEHGGTALILGSTSPQGSSSTGQMAEVSRSHYRVRLASSQTDIRAAQLLRFVVFNLELREGLEQSYSTCLDADAFDPVCDHLLVEDLRTGEVIGTYRLQTGRKAANHLGYYSAQEFDFSPYDSLRQEMVELGRACVHGSHRNLVVLGLLWKGISNYAAGFGCRYLIGCSSLTSQDPAIGWAAYGKIQSSMVKPEWRTTPLPKFVCPPPETPVPAPKIPKLLAAYLMFGAKICGPPALDREFKTIDFLTFIDLQSIPVRNLERYTS
jgi:putative hemolysin